MKLPILLIVTAFRYAYIWHINSKWTTDMLIVDTSAATVPLFQARKTFKIAWDPEFPRKIAFEIFLVKPTPITLINQFLCRKGPL